MGKPKPVQDVTAKEPFCSRRPGGPRLPPPKNRPVGHREGGHLRLLEGGAVEGVPDRDVLPPRQRPQRGDLEGELPAEGLAPPVREGHDVSADSGLADVDEIPRGALSAGGDELNPADVDRLARSPEPGPALAQVRIEIEGATQVAARSPRKDPERRALAHAPRAFARHRSFEEPVHHLVDGAVAADRDDEPRPSSKCLAGQFLGVARSFGEDVIAFPYRRARGGGDVVEMAPRGTARGARIHDQEVFRHAGADPEIPSHRETSTTRSVAERARAQAGLAVTGAAPQASSSARLWAAMPSATAGSDRGSRPAAPQQLVSAPVRTGSRTSSTARASRARGAVSSASPRDSSHGSCHTTEMASGGRSAR